MKLKEPRCLWTMFAFFHQTLKAVRSDKSSVTEILKSATPDAYECKFGYREVDFVGDHISGNGVAPIADNVEAILIFLYHQIYLS